MAAAVPRNLKKRGEKLRKGPPSVLKRSSVQMRPKGFRIDVCSLS
jgi:hypothetical protein